MQITNFLFLCNPELPKDLSINNSITVNWCSAIYPWRPNAGITPLHMSWWWSRCSRPQGRWRTWCNDSGATRAALPRTHTHTVIMMTPRNFWSSRDCENRWLWTSARRCAAVVWCQTYAALRGAMWERERWRWRGRRTRRERRRQVVCCCVSLPPPGPPLYSRERRRPYPSTKAAKGGGQGERRQRLRQGQPAPTAQSLTLAGRLGPRGPRRPPFPYPIRGRHIWP
jgi:hypothetical protein